MTQLIQLKLSKIKYSGDSIGDDIRVEIEILDRFLSVNKIIKAGTTKDINQEIERWDELCEILMRARKGDGENIGILEVVD